MATIVAGAGLMANGSRKFIDLAGVIRFASWIMPPHRKEWADAMLNEMAYIGSRRAAWHWVLGCALFAIKQRAFYELARTFTPRGIRQALFRLGAVSVMLVIGVYMISKPYQRERILMVVFQHGTTMHHMKVIP